MKKLLVTCCMALILAFACQEVVAQGPTAEADIEFMDSTEVLSLLDEAVRLQDGDSIQFVLERALYIAKNIDFDYGVQGAFTGLIRSFRNRNEISSELRVRLQLLNYLEKRKRWSAITEEWVAIGDLYFENEIYPKARESYVVADSFARKTDPSLHYQLVRQLARASLRVGDLSAAERYFSEGKQLAQKSRNFDDVLWSYQQLGRVAHANEAYGQELKLAKAAYALADSLGREKERIIALNNIGYAYKYTKNTAKAVEYFEQVLEALPSNSRGETRAATHANLGILHQSQANSIQAIQSLAAAADEYGFLGRKADQATAQDFIALVYYQNKDPYNALAYNDKSIDLAESGGALEVLQSCYRTRSLIYQDLYEFEEALASYQKFLDVRDQINTRDRSRKENILQQQYTMERMEKELSLLYANEELKDVEIEKLSAESDARAKKAELKELEAAQALDQLMLSEQKRKVEEQQSRIALLDRENLIKVLELDKERDRAENAQLKATREEARAENERLKAEEKATEVTVLTQQKQLQSLELEQQNASIKNLFFLVGGLGLLVLLILLALAALRRKNSVIARERKKSDELLLNILPAQVAAELKANGRSEPRFYEDVTVIFTDFAGFTQISELLSPADLVAKLDKIFLEFDQIMEAEGLTRIKTIGDAYMAACGLPEPDTDHANKAVRAALSMRDYIQRFNAQLAPNEPHWNIRIGINSGPVVAGVVGIRKFAYDIWGDTVNTASRMESSGQVGKVNISGSTFALVNDRFYTEYRGKVQAKNKGEIDMYFAESAATPSR